MLLAKHQTESLLSKGARHFGFSQSLKPRFLFPNHKVLYSQGNANSGVDDIKTINRFRLLKLKWKAEVLQKEKYKIEGAGREAKHSTFLVIQLSLGKYIFQK